MASVMKGKGPELAASNRSIRTETVVDGVDCSLAEARGIGNDAYTRRTPF